MYFLYTLLGLLFVSTAGYSVAENTGKVANFFLKKQVVFTIGGICICLFISFLNQEFAKYTIPLFAFTSLILLAMVPFFGNMIKGSRRWITIFGFQLQPMEFAKTAVILFNAITLSAYSKNIEGKKNSYLLIIDGFLIVSTLLLLFKQPDIGNCLLTFVVLCAQIAFVDKIKIKHVVLLICVVCCLFVTAYFSFNHVRTRVDNFLKSFTDIEKSQYQVKRSIRSYQNAGLFGKGYLESEVKSYIPDSHTDFIFPVITEEFGFIPACLLLLSELWLIIRIYLLSIKYRDSFYFFALCGLATLFATQTIINLAVSINLLPTKGMTLPLFSYGGSSTLANAINFGFILIFTRKDILTSENNKTIDSIE